MPNLSTRNQGEASKVNLTDVIASLMNGNSSRRTNRYPTKEEILAEPLPTHKIALLRAIKVWKKQVWAVSRGSMEDKNRALESLVNTMADVYDKPCNFTVNLRLPSPCYRTDSRTIVMNASASVISTMHEFAHHLFGHDETKACRWSVHLFRKTFPKAYAQLVWDRHTLRKPNVLLD